MTIIGNTPTPVILKPTATSGGGGGGGYAPTPVITPNIQPLETKNPEKSTLVTAENKPIFNVPKLGDKCVSIIKNLDDSLLLDYMNKKLNISLESNLHADATLGEFIKMLFLAAEIPTDSIDYTKIKKFNDINPNSPYYPYFALAVNYGLMHGQTDGTNNFLRPGDTITRAEASKIFIRAANLEISKNFVSFADVNPTMSLVGYIQAAYENCLLRGRKTLNGEPIDVGPRIFEPESPITISETAKVLYNMKHR